MVFCLPFTQNRCLLGAVWGWRVRALTTPVIFYCKRTVPVREGLLFLNFNTRCSSSSHGNTVLFSCYLELHLNSSSQTRTAFFQLQNILQFLFPWHHIFFTVSPCNYLIFFMFSWPQPLYRSNDCKNVLHYVSPSVCLPVRLSADLNTGYNFRSVHDTVFTSLGIITDIIMTLTCNPEWPRRACCFTFISRYPLRVHRHTTKKEREKKKNNAETLKQSWPRG